MRGDLLRSGRVAVFLIDVDEIDVGRHVELARAELAHADDPEIDALARLVQRLAEAQVELAARMRERKVERGLGQLRHREGDVRHGSTLLDVEHGEPLEHELSRDAQGTGEYAAIGLQALDQRDDGVAPRQSRRKQRQLACMAAAHALHEAAVVGGDEGKGRRQRCEFRDLGQQGNVRQGTHGLGGGLC